MFFRAAPRRHLSILPTIQAQYIIYFMNFCFFVFVWYFLSRRAATRFRHLADHTSTIHYIHYYVLFVFVLDVLPRRAAARFKHPADHPSTIHYILCDVLFLFLFDIFFRAAPRRALSILPTIQAQYIVYIISILFVLVLYVLPRRAAARFKHLAVSPSTIHCICFVNSLFFVLSICSYKLFIT